MPGDWYILGEDGVPVGPYDHRTYARVGGWDDANRFIARTELDDGTVVSTVFLGLDHNYSGEGGPVLFETMVFPPDSSLEQACERSRNRHAALAVHDRLVAEYRAKLRSP